MAQRQPTVNCAAFAHVGPRCPGLVGAFVTTATRHDTSKPPQTTTQTSPIAIVNHDPDDGARIATISSADRPS